MLSEALRDRDHLFASLWGLWVYHLVRAEMATALNRSENMLRVALAHADIPEELAEAYSAVGLTKVFQGQLVEAVDDLNKGIEAYNRMTKDPQNLLLRLDPKVQCLSMLERAHYFMGRPNEAIALGEQAVEHAIKLKQPYSIAFAKMFLSYIHYFRGDMRAAVQLGTEAVHLAESQGLQQVLAWAVVGTHRALGANEEQRAGSIMEIRKTVEALEVAGARVCCPQFVAMLCELLIQNGNFTDAEQEIDRGISISETTGNRDYLAELLRLKAHVMVARNVKGTAHDEPTKLLNQAAAISFDQGALSHTLRILTSQVALDTGTRRERQSRQKLKGALARMPNASEQKSGDYALALDVLRMPPGSGTKAKDWWQRLLVRC